MTSPSSHPVIVLLTVNDHETDAVLDAFLGSGVAPLAVSKGGLTYFDLGIHGGHQIYQSHCVMGAGGLGAAQQRTSEVIAHWSPAAIIAVGIAFGIDENKQKIGDVLVAQQLQDYELGRQNADGTLTPRGDKAQGSAILLNRVTQTDALQRRGNTSWPKVRIGLMLSGQKLIDNLDYRESLKKLHTEAIGGEMEGTGVYVSAQHAKTDWLVVKAICDWGHDKNQADKDAWQKTAAANAAVVVKAALDVGCLYEGKNGAATLANSEESIASGKSGVIQIVAGGETSPTSPALPETPTPQTPIVLPAAAGTTSAPLSRKTDQDFVAHARKEIARILASSQALKTAVEQRLAEPDAAAAPDLVALLERSCVLEAVVNDYLRQPTIACLDGLPQEGNDFRQRWVAACGVLAWLAVLSVKGDWIEDFERRCGGFTGLQVDIPVATGMGVEIVSSRYRQQAIALPNDTGRADLHGTGRIETPSMPESYVMQNELDALLLRIWNKLLPEEDRTSLAAHDLLALNSELHIRARTRTEHNYLAFFPEANTSLNQEGFLPALLEKLPNLMVIRMTPKQGGCPLLVGNEYDLVATIRSFLKIPELLLSRSSATTMRSSHALP